MLPAELIRTIRRIEIRTRHLVNDSFAGEYQAIFKGRGMEFDQVRRYQPGDDVRTIDWNVTARVGEPHVKRYVEERELTVMLAFDASASGRFGTAGRLKAETAAELGAVLAFSAITNNDKVGLLAFTDQIEFHIPPRKGRRHVLRLIRELLTLNPVGRRTDIASALEHLNRTLKRRAIIFLISDFFEPRVAQGRYERSLRATSRRHDLVALTITDPREMAWPAVGLVRVRDAETGTTARIDTGNPGWRSAFVRQAERQSAARAATLQHSRVDRIDITVGEDYVRPLLMFFEMRGRRRSR